jgi:hypothetical protein
VETIHGDVFVVIIVRIVEDDDDDDVSICWWLLFSEKEGVVYRSGCAGVRTKKKQVGSSGSLFVAGEQPTQVY